MSNDVEVFHVRKLLVEGSQLVKVSSKQAESADVGRNMPSGAIRYNTSKENLISYSDIDHARPNPSYVDVPEEKSNLDKMCLVVQQKTYRGRAHQ
jgi:hypothetical protein